MVQNQDKKQKQTRGIHQAALHRIYTNAMTPWQLNHEEQNYGIISYLGRAIGRIIGPTRIRHPPFSCSVSQRVVVAARSRLFARLMRLGWRVVSARGVQRRQRRSLVMSSSRAAAGTAERGQRGRKRTAGCRRGGVRIRMRQAGLMGSRRVMRERMGCRRRCFGR